jgi:hypothetical protein
VGQQRLGPSYFFISLVLGPLNSLLWYVPSSRYIWSSDPILFLQEQIKTIIIILLQLTHPCVSMLEKYCMLYVYVYKCVLRVCARCVCVSARERVRVAT